ncbi:PKD domain-containing protein [Methanothermococcus sp. Ax23]|uniref:PKD domain-containing protein n=1 Tax=Methanothermococcus sp. Ax23 TaxID=3156486 RepID=UPI003BA2C0E1
MKAYSILLSLIMILGALPLGFASETTENVAVVVSTPADAIVAAPYAKAMGYKLVYTPTDELSDDAKRELERNNINKVIIVGGPVAVSNSVENQINKLHINIKRVWGETRIETSQKMYELIKEEKPEMVNNIVVAEGFNEKIIPVAVSFGAPVVYYGLDKDDEVANLLKTAKPENAVILGSKIPKIITNTVSGYAKNTIIASGSDDSVIKTALAYVPRINPNAENKDVAVVYAEKTNNPILDAVVSFVNGYVGAIAPIPVSKEDMVNKIISKLTFASGVSVSSDSTSMSNIISNIASKAGLSSTSMISRPSGGGGGTTTTPTTPVDNKPVINNFTVSIDGLDTTFTINVSDDNGLKKIVLKYGDGTEKEETISGTSYNETIKTNYHMQGKYTATLVVYDDNGQQSTKSIVVNLKYFDVNPEYISKIRGNVDEYIPIIITNYQDNNITITTTNTTTNANLTVSTNGSLTIYANSQNTTTCIIKNTSALASGKSYQAKITFALNSHPEINKTFVFDIAVPKQETITTTGNSSVSLQIVNTTDAGTTSITIDDNATNNAFIVNTAVGSKSIDIIIPTKNTSDTSTIENTTIHLENIKDALDRAEEIQNTSTLTEELIKPVVIASKDVENVSVYVKNITIDDDTNETTINTEIKFENTTDTYVVIAIPVGNTSVSEVYKEGLGTIPEYDSNADQTNYFKYDATNGILTLFMKEDPFVQIKLKVNAVNNRPVISMDNPVINGLSVAINASKSYDPENKTLTYKWLAPGSQSIYPDNSCESVVITYPADGTYNITLTISDGVYEVSKVITVKPKLAVKVVANGKTVGFVGQNDSTLSITGTETLNLPNITANVNVVDKKDTSKGVEIYFKDNESVESVIEAMNNFNTVSYNGDTITINYSNIYMTGNNVSLSIISSRSSFRDAVNKLLNGNATDLINLLHENYEGTATVLNGVATFNITANDSNADYIVVITNGNMITPDSNNVNVLAIGGFEVMKYNMTLTYNGTDMFNTTTYIISLNDTPTNNTVRYGLAMINKNVGITLNVVGTNPNNNLFNVTVVGNSGSEIVVENNDFITLSASKINDIIGTIYTPDTASATYSPVTTNSTVSLDLNNVSDSYVIGIAYDTVDKKIVAVEQQ